MAKDENLKTTLKYAVWYFLDGLIFLCLPIIKLTEFELNDFFGHKAGKHGQVLKLPNKS